jgi:UDP-3-O-[3-hydroxymyristoyl] glucosamine N-acyltransferase
MIELSDLTQQIGVEFEGKSITISSLNTLSDATSSELSFLENKKYVDQLQKTKAGAVLVTANMAEHVPEGTIAVVVEEPYLALAKASKLFAPAIVDTNAPAAVIGEGSYIADGAHLANGATVGKNCTIMPGVYIGRGAVIGDNTILHSNVSIYHDCTVGSDCIIHSSTVIGSDGFGFATTKLGTHVKIYQNGHVVVEDDVEIGASTTIDRAVGQTGVAGSTTLGRNVVLGAQSGVVGHIQIAPFTTFAARTGVTKSVTESGKTFAGFPMMDHRMWLKLQAKMARLIK